MPTNELSFNHPLGPFDKSKRPDTFGISDKERVKRLGKGLNFLSSKRRSVNMTEMVETKYLEEKGVYVEKKDDKLEVQRTQIENDMYLK